MAESWRSVSDYEGLYEISDFGQVNSIARPSTRGGILKQKTEKDTGYQAVTLSKDGVERQYRVHVLVLTEFVSPRLDGLEGRHMNGDPSDNQLTNLVWGTSQENSLDVTRHGRNRNANKTRCKRRHPLEGENLKVGARGHRMCRACECARSARKRGSIRIEEEMQDYADQVFNRGVNR